MGVAMVMDHDLLNITIVNTTNATVNATLDDDNFGLINQILITIALVLIMIGMGSTLTPKDIWVNLRRPTGIAIGFASQFGIMPLVGFGLAHIMKLDPHTAIGTLVLACCPGGTVSNIFTYWTNGDVCLSICMTTCSTILATGMMPLCLFAYSRSWVDAITVIPYVDIMLAVIAILVPAAIGMIIKWRSDKVAKVATKVCSAGSLVLILVITIILGVTQPDIYQSDWKPWVLTAIYPILAFSCGYTIASILRLPHRKRRTVAFETGCQNVALALTVLNLSFPRTPALQKMMVVPVLFSLFLFIDALVVCLVYVLYIKFHRSQEKDTTEIVTPTTDEVTSNEKEPPATNGAVANAGFQDRNANLTPKGVFHPSFAPVVGFSNDTLDVEYRFHHQETQTKNEKRRESDARNSKIIIPTKFVQFEEADCVNFEVLKTDFEDEPRRRDLKRPMSLHSDEPRKQDLRRPWSVCIDASTNTHTINMTLGDPITKDLNKFDEKQIIGIKGAESLESQV
ncbi:ileal sodium/bile acid cotransporter-like [Glandiceps talaboti]